MNIHSLELPPLATESSGGTAAPVQRLHALAGVRTELSVVAGRASASVGEILGLQAGTVLNLDAELNAPFDVMLGDQVVARGELIAVGDRFGLRVTEVAPHGTVG
jgi:flagellar motor switch protein FliN/FliY